MSLSWWSLLLNLLVSCDEFFATGKSGAFNERRVGQDPGDFLVNLSEARDDPYVDGVSRKLAIRDEPNIQLSCSRNVKNTFLLMKNVPVCTF